MANLHESEMSLDRLYGIVTERKETMPKGSYTAGLFIEGRARIAQKVGEEGVEVAIAGVLNDQARIIEESADLLLHLIVLWVDGGISPQIVLNELARRHTQSTPEE